MKKLVTVILEPRTPFAISRHRERNVASTLDHVPGSTLRGALAAAWMRFRGMPDETFDRVFQSGRNRFPFCYPGRGVPAPAPLTAMTCKAHGGPDGHGLVDGARALLDRAIPSPRNCPREGCGEKLVRWGGLVARGTGGFILDPVRETRMHAGIRRETGSVQEGVLFGTTVVLPVAHRGRGHDDAQEPLVLEGIGLFEEEDLRELRSLLEACDHAILVGRSRSTGLGEMRVRLEEGSALPGLEDRLARWEQFSCPLPDGEGLPVGITLLSPAILERNGVFSFDPLAEVREALGVAGGAGQGGGTEPAVSLVQPTRVFGWDMAARGPKPIAEAVAAGSIVLGRSRLDREKLLEVMARLEEEGIGARREEGFGRVLAWDPVLVEDQQ